MNDSLFRSEALAHRSAQHAGPILLLRPLSFRIVTAGAALLAFALVMTLCFMEYTQKATIAGQLAPREGVLAVNAPAAGVVVDVRVEEGQSVRKGDVLFVLSAERRTNQGDTQAAISARLQQRRDELIAERVRQQQLQSQEQRALQQRLADLSAEQRELDSQIASQAARVKSFESSLRRFEALQTQGHVSAIQVQEKREEGLTEQATLHALKRDRIVLDREATQLRTELAALPLRLKSQESALERETAELEQDLAESEAQREFVLTAGQDGVVTALAGELGSAVVMNTRLATIVPQGATLEAQLLASSRDVGFIEPGKRVQLRYHAYPYQKFGQYEGRVVAVTRTTLTEGEGNHDHAHQPMYRVHVALTAQNVSARGAQYQLQPGMQVDAAVLLDRRRLIEWVFEPVLGFSGRLKDARHD